MRPLSIFHGLTRGMNNIGTIWIFALVFLINADVIGRFVFNSPIKGVPEMVGLSIVGIVYLELANTLRANRFIRSDVLVGRLFENSPRIGHALQAVHHAFGAILAFVIFYFTYPRFLQSYDVGEYVGTEGDFTAPVWPIKFLILLGCFTLLIQFLLHVYRDINIVLGRKDPKQTAKDQAAP